MNENDAAPLYSTLLSSFHTGNYFVVFDHVALRLTAQTTTLALLIENSCARSIVFAASELVV